MLKGEALSIETTPVAVRLVMLGFGVLLTITLISVLAESGGESEGQHSGLSSLHPIRGTSMTAPPYRDNLVYCGTLQVPTRIA
jgi:hypothetical protein